MASCTFILNGQNQSTLITPVGTLTAFSGDGPNRNNPASEGVPDGGPIPGGMYYIVARQSGGLIGPARDWLLGRDEWFALYRDDDSIDDWTFIRDVKRGLFRMHPLGPRRMSTGCIVLQYREEFERLRKHLLSSPPDHIPGSGLPSYGTVSVGQPAPDQLDPRFQNGGRSPRQVAV
jgi:hypothetical protein